MDLKLHPRTVQFSVELARAWPHLTIPQVTSAALQLAENVELEKIEGFEAMKGLVSRLQLRPASEWDLFGYAPTNEAVPIRLEQPRESELSEIAFEDHFLSTHTRRAHSGVEHLPSHTEVVSCWRRRLGSATTPNLDYAEFTQQGFGRKIPLRRVEMLGNLWKIGAVATWEYDHDGETSWCYLDRRPATGERPDPAMNEWNAWYRIQLNPEIGRDVVVEVARCVAEIYLGYVDKVFGTPTDAGTQRGPESEAAAYIAVERLWVPPRSRRTEWFHNYTAREPMAPGFRWEAVFRAAEAVEDLLRGDTAPVTA
ncbi:hypothetical protein CATRI_09550 [Corynebacterium atrinae]|uniref:hypothetical protein n=1 Tax=Corynebacterium atrinae TaxID=1336740 RepID=UPI0025B40A55|nr:hypothetical protein [Corynebacterium atrinae]WJY63978.1 hypothetical protein CATRI_09550 [Corynebacterium atrinae]